MSAAGSTDAAPLSPLVEAAARGELPEWTRAGPKRRAHMGRVAALMRQWAEALPLPQRDVVRWTATGWLHDVLREADPEELRPHMPLLFRPLPGKLLHGPAAAERLRDDLDPEMCEAIRFHTLGSPRFGRLGRALYLADFLEPGRTFDPAYTESLRARMPGDMDAIFREVVRLRWTHITGKGGTAHPETQALYEQVESEA
ncbi:MAG TPA: HD domain-containing protein [Longimicrobium sp.]|nr:HD domain-containing protein [Longimicrobium sp.]